MVGKQKQKGASFC